MVLQLVLFHHTADRLFANTKHHNPRIVGEVDEAFESLTIGIRGPACFFNDRNDCRNR